MIKNLILASSLVISVFLIFKNYGAPANSSELRDPFNLSLDNKEITTAFVEVGIVNFQKNLTAQQACPFDDHALVSCLEGYYFAEASEQILKGQINQSGDPTRQLGVGMAFAKKKLEPKSEPYLVDGWAFTKSYENNGFLNNLMTNCSAKFIEKNMSRYCYWGAGRAAYFLNFNLALAKSYPQEFMLGYNFAKIFATPTQVIPTQSSSKQNLENISFFIKLSSSGKNLDKLPRWIQCAYSSHLLDCVNPQDL